MSYHIRFSVQQGRDEDALLVGAWLRSFQSWWSDRWSLSTVVWTRPWSWPHALEDSHTLQRRRGIIHRVSKNKQNYFLL